MPATGRPQPKIHNEQPQPPDERLGIAVVGLGKLSLGEILPALEQSTGCRLAGLVSGNADKARDVARRYGVPADAIYDYDDFDRIADDPRFAAVYIVLPNALHLAFTERAFRAGKHVLCEKPMATTVEDCEAMLAAGEAAGRRLMIAYRCHYEPNNLAAIRTIREGRVGDLRAIGTHNGRPADPKDPADPWRLQAGLSGGGSLFDIGIYGLNGARYLAGEEPVEVRAWSYTADDPRFAETPDVIAWQLRFSSGLIANGTCSFSYATTSRLEAIGTKGRVALDPATPYVGIKLMVQTADGDEIPKIHPVNQFAAEMDHFAKCLRDGTPFHSPGEEGLQDVRLMVAILESARTGKPVATDFGYRRKTDLLQGAKG
jgi:predicted dehydrogenase